MLIGKIQFLNNRDEEDIPNNIEDGHPFSSRLPFTNDESNLEKFNMWENHGEGIQIKDHLKEKKNG